MPKPIEVRTISRAEWERELLRKRMEQEYRTRQRMKRRVHAVRIAQLSKEKAVEIKRLSEVLDAALKEDEKIRQRLGVRKRSEKTSNLSAPKKYFDWRERKIRELYELFKMPFSASSSTEATILRGASLERIVSRLRLVLEHGFTTITSPTFLLQIGARAINHLEYRKKTSKRKIIVNPPEITQRIIEEYTPLAQGIAKGMARSRGLNPEDFTQIAMEALTKAARITNTRNRGHATSYLALRIRGAIFDYMRREMQEKTGLSRREYALAKRVPAEEREAFIEELKREKKERIEETRTKGPTPEEKVLVQGMINDVKARIRKHKQAKRWLKILQRFSEGLTNREVAKRFRVTESRISQIMTNDLGPIFKRAGWKGTPSKFVRIATELGEKWKKFFFQK